MKLAQMRSRELYFLRHERNWFCVTVTPQKETLVSQQLMERGVDTFIPINIRWRKKNRTTREKVPMPFVAFPGYLFIGHTSSIFPWGQVSQLDHITGAIGFNGYPRQLNLDSIGKFLGKFREGLEPDKVERNMRSNREYKTGDRAEVMSGQYKGHVVEVSSIQGRTAKFEIELFNRIVFATIDSFDLEKVA